MRKTLLYSLLITVITLITILALPNLLPERKLKIYNNDDELRKAAISRGMLPVPKDYKQLLKIKDNYKLTREKIALGKELYFDTNLSKNRDMSCATCHVISKDKKYHDNSIANGLVSTDTIDERKNCISCHLRDESGVDRFSNAIGEDGKEDPYHLNTMTILNSSLAKYLTWSAKAISVEDEVGLSITSIYKMNMPANLLENRFKKDSVYVKKFKKAFENNSSIDPINFKNIKEALGSYVRTLLTRGSYDRFLDGDNSAISIQAKKGLADFINLGCKGCHTGMSVGGQVIEKFPLKAFLNIEELGFKTPFISATNIFPFDNIGGFLGKDNENLFRVPILRNVTKTSPYFHNGSVPKIREAVAIMGKHQLGIELTETQIDELVAFLKTLEGERVDYVKDGE
jgi:cytochrome c peroxidase